MGFVLKIDGEDVWESEYEASSVTRISIRTAQGEAAAVGSPTGQDWMDIHFTTVSPGEEELFAGNIEARNVLERAEKIEEIEKDRVTEGRAEMQAAEKEEAEEVDVPTETSFETATETDKVSL